MTSTLIRDVADTRRGDVDAYRRVVEATQTMAYGAALAVLREPAATQDVVQEAYLQAFRRIAELREPAAFPGWLRRIVVTGALNVRRARRVTLLRLEDLPEVPVLDDQEARWSDAQRRALSLALLGCRRPSAGCATAGITAAGASTVSRGTPGWASRSCGSGCSGSETSYEGRSR